jgi:hypothetical protein
VILWGRSCIVFCVNFAVEKVIAYHDHKCVDGLLWAFEKITSGS